MQSNLGNLRGAVPTQHAHSRKAPQEVFHPKVDELATCHARSQSLPGKPASLLSSPEVCEYTAAALCSCEVGFFRRARIASTPNADFRGPKVYDIVSCAQAL